MMIPNKYGWSVLLVMALGVVLVAPSAQAKPAAAKKKVKAAAAEASPAPEATPSLEPKAIEVLKAASNRLAAAHTLKLNAIHFYESSSRCGHPLAITTKSEVTIQWPDKLRVIMSDDRPAYEVLDDGMNMNVK